jgi:hypothetical protein
VAFIRGLMALVKDRGPSPLSIHVAKVISMSIQGCVTVTTTSSGEMSIDLCSSSDNVFCCPFYFTIPRCLEGSNEEQGQGFPILINRTGTGEDQSQCLVKMGIKIAHLASDIAHAEAIQETQDGTIELGEQAGNRASTGLAGIFP